MPRLGTNIATNLIAGFWTTLLTALITPVQVRLLGIESYGVIGFITTLQVVFAVFDAGLSSTITRQIASDSADSHCGSQKIVRTAISVYWMVAIALGISLCIIVPDIARYWFRSTSLQPTQIQQALYLIVIFLALRWPVALYIGVLTGLQKMVPINLIKVLVVTLRLGGGIIVILVWRNIEAFLLFYLLTAATELLLFQFVATRQSPFALWPPEFSTSVLRSSLAFTSSMGAISVLALVISNIDRVLVYRMLPLAEAGYYTLAFTVASLASLGIASVSTAMLPAFAERQTEADRFRLQSSYLSADKLILTIVGGVSFALIFFGEIILTLWIGPQEAAAAALTASLLSAGFLASAVVSNAFNVAVAAGRPDIPLRVSATSVIPYSITLYVLIASFGGLGAGLAWLLLNLAYVLVLPPIVHRLLLGLSTGRWLAQAVLPVLGAGIASFGGARLALEIFDIAAGPATRVAGLIAAALVFLFFLLATATRAEKQALAAMMPASLRLMRSKP